MSELPTADSGSCTRSLRRLVEEVRREVRRSRSAGAAARAVADVVEPRLRDPDLLTADQRRPGDDGYRQHVLHVEEDGSFSVVSLVWRPGQRTPIHDHVSWCVPAVYEGREEETRYRLVGAGRAEAAEDGGPPSGTGDPGRAGHLEEAGTTINGPGDVGALSPPGDIHRVRNPGPETAISVHVYGANIDELGSSIRRTYDLEVRGGPG